MQLLHTRIRARASAIAPVPGIRPTLYYPKMHLGRSSKVAKTCYAFEDDNEDDQEHDNEQMEQRHRRFLHQRQIACLNKLYYTEQMAEEDLVEWMKRRWGKAHVMKFVRVNGEMTLRVFRNEPTVTHGDSYDDIAYALNDCLRMEYVKYHLSAQMKVLKKGNKDFIDIPLSIYYDGTM